MALDLDKTRKNAERLLKQGRVQAALEEYQRLAEESPRDLPLLNLVGDLLGRMGRPGEALVYYDRIAAEYSRSGFFLKAIAILKKVLKTEPDRAEVLLRVGDLYLKQKLPGEARGYLLQAADRFVAARSFREAQDVYRKLVEAEPGDPLHRLRLAEALAAVGDSAGAGQVLLEVAEATRSGGRPAEAEKIFRRVLDLLPGRTDAVAGLTRCLAAQGKVSEAVAILGRALQSRPDAGLAVLLVSIDEQAGRGEEALRVLTGSFADAMPDEAFERVLRSRAEQGEGDAVWAALEPLLTRWTSAGALDRLARLLDRLSRVEADGHLPALKRLYDLRRQQADGFGMVKVLEALARAYRARSMDDEASAVEERLEELAPAARPGRHAAESDEAAAPSAGEPAAATGQAAAEAAPGSGAGATEIPAGIEMPAVPLGLSDEEFVAGRLTQAEIFEKYGLMDQAVEQLREVTKRFPGLAKAQERLAELLRIRGDRDGLRDALVGLALAYRASGEHERARGVAAQADLSSPLSAETRSLLERLALLPAAPEAEAPEATRAPVEPAAAAAQAAPPRTEPAARETPRLPAGAPTRETPARAAQPRAAAPVPARPAPPPMAEPAPQFRAPDRVAEAHTPAPQPPLAPPAPARAAPPVATPRPEPEPTDSAEDEIVIEIDDEPASAREEEAPSPKPAAPASTLPAPAPDDLEEIAFYLDQGMIHDARKLIALQRARGRGGAALDTLEARAASAKAPSAEEEPVVETVEEIEARSDLTLDDEALESITKALGVSAEAPQEEAAPPASFDEQSVEEVFELFKRHVEQEIGREDHRTHYDLGIAYKEMGLLDDAVSEFRIATGAPDLFRDACSMIALCLREKGEVQEAAGWYRQALDAPGGDDEALRGLRFDLAEVLEQCGDIEAALDLFRAIHRDDPSYREVGQRISEIEARDS